MTVRARSPRRARRGAKYFGGVGNPCEAAYLTCFRVLEITNRRGLHARASAKFVNLASELPAKFEVEKDGNRVCGTSIMGADDARRGDGRHHHPQLRWRRVRHALEKLSALVIESLRGRLSAPRTIQLNGIECRAKLPVSRTIRFKFLRGLRRQEGAARIGHVPGRGAAHPDRSARLRPLARPRCFFTSAGWRCIRWHWKSWPRPRRRART